MLVPPDLKYTKSDEWVKVQGNIGTIGVTDYAQSQLSDVVFVEIIAKVGDEAKKGKVCASLESVKAAADVNYPLDGKIIEINEMLPAAPETVNSDPYNVAWMIKIQISNSADLSSLMDAAAYEAYCQERSA